MIAEHEKRNIAMKNTEEAGLLGHLPKIDIMRAVAIMVVFAVHALTGLIPNYGDYSYGANGLLELNGVKSVVLNLNPLAFGWSSIHLFLLISGFGIHLGYLRSEGSFSARKFFNKRFWRVYPPYLLILLFMCVFRRGIVYYFFTKEGMTDFVSHLFLVNNFSNTTFFTIDGTFWSLAAEVQLYLLYPLFRYSNARVGVKKTFLWIFGISMALQLIGVATNNYGPVNFAYDWSPFKFWFVWAAGAWLAESYHNQKRVFGNKGLMWTFGLLAILTVSKCFSMTQYFQTYIATFMWMAFFEWFVTTEKIKATGWIAKVLISVGLCSYSMYLIHLPYLRQLMSLFSINPYPDHSGLVKYVDLLVKPAVAFVIMYLISYSMYILIEQKSIAIGQQLRKRKALREK